MLQLVCNKLYWTLEVVLIRPVKIPAARRQPTEQRSQILDMPGDQVAHVTIGGIALKLP